MWSTHARAHLNRHGLLRLTREGGGGCVGATALAFALSVAARAQLSRRYVLLQVLSVLVLVQSESHATVGDSRAPVGAGEAWAAEEIKSEQSRVRRVMAHSFSRRCVIPAFSWLCAESSWTLLSRTARRAGLCSSCLTTLCRWPQTTSGRCALVLYGLRSCSQGTRRELTHCVQVSEVWVQCHTSR